MILLSLLLSSAFAVTSGSLVVSGTVPLACDIVITASGNTALNIQAGDTNYQVATVTETCNNPTGYHITMASANAGQLRRTPTDFTTYQTSYDLGAYATPGAAATTVKTVASLASAITYNSTLRVNVVAKPTALAGTYSDSLTIAILAP